MRSLRIPFKVTACTTYDDSRLPSYTDLVQSAWILQPHSKRRPAGFVHARELNPDELQAVVFELGRDDE
jgi:hypothetical protein